MEQLPYDIEQKLERLPVIPFDSSEVFQNVLVSPDFDAIYKYYHEHYLPEELKSQQDGYKRAALYLTLTNQDTSVMEDFDQLLYRRPVPSIEEFLDGKRYMGYSNSTLYPYWRERLCELFRVGSPIRKAIFGGSIGCLSSDTVIATLNGDKTISELLKDFSNTWVLSFNTSTKAWEPDKILDVFFSGYKDTYRITLDNGEHIDCTKDHKFLTRHNKWVSIDNGLEVGTSMLSHLKEYNRYVSIKIIEYLGKQNVYDITTEKNHNFALKSGIIAHNCGKSTVARKCFAYVIYRLLCLRYARAAFNIDQDSTIASVIISMTLKQVYDTNLLPVVKLMETMPCFQRVDRMRSFENFDLNDPRTPFPFAIEKSTATIFFPDNIIVTCGSNQTHLTGYNVVNSFCLTENTQIYTTKGNITIKDLVYRFNKGETFKTLAYNGEETDIINAQETNKVNELIKIWFDDEHYVECTPNHMFVIMNPKPNDEHIKHLHHIPFKEAKYLTEDDEIADALSKEELLKLYRKERKTLKQISLEKNIDLSYLYILLSRYKITKNTNLNIIILDKDKLYKEYINNNKTRKEIAKMCNVSEAFVKKKLREFGISKPVELYHINTTKACKELQPKIVQKRKQTCLKKYAVEYYTLHEDFQKKAHETLSKNHTWISSKFEEKVYILLSNKFYNVKRQYKSELYPFHCDFYIPKLNLYIEIQGTWGHGGRPYDENDLNCQKLLLKWKNGVLKCGQNSSYNNAINVWTVRDPLKRETAKKNHLNWLEFFTMDQFMDWYNEN